MLWVSFRIFVRQIWEDAMLVMVLIAPFLAGLAFRCGLPAVDNLLEIWLGSPVLAPWFPLVDLFLAILAPYMLLFASAMVLLEERDEGLSVYLAVTPLGKRGYLLSRLLLPSVIACAMTFVVLTLFSLVPLSIPARAALSLAAAVLGLILSLLVYSLAGNRIEGMALAKMSSIILIAVAVPFVSRSPWRFLAAPLPSFWLGEAAVYQQPLAFLAFAGVALLWLLFLVPLFRRRMARG